MNNEPMYSTETFIPMFPGFYNSYYDGLIDSEVELLVDNYADIHPHLDRGALFDAIYNNVDYSEVYKRIAQIHAEVFIKHLTEAVRELPGFESQAEPAWRFVQVVSPRFYNFENDRVLIRIEESFIHRIFESRDRDVFAKVVRERHSSYDGFISFYTNYMSDPEWRDVDSFDCNQTETLLLSIIEQVTDRLDFSNAVVNEVMEEATVRGFVEDCLDYGTVDSRIEQLNNQLNN